MKITEKSLEEAIRKTEEKLELLRTQLQILKNQRMIDLKHKSVKESIDIKQIIKKTLKNS